MSSSAAPPSPQEIERKLSVHSVARKPSKPHTSCHVSLSGVSGTESDSDSILTPDVSLLPAGMSVAASLPQHPPLSAIAELRDGSGAEDSEEEDEEDGGWKTPDVSKAQISGLDEKVLKAGYLWKKGERRKTWKKRWFVLRPAHLAYYKTAAEYQLLRLLELSDIHSCTQVTLKRHNNTFGLISPVRTFYLQAKTPEDVQEWVAAIEAARLALQGTVEPAASNPIPIPTVQHRTTSHALTPSPPSSFPALARAITSSDSEDASPNPRSLSVPHSRTQPVVASPSQPVTVKDPGKTVLSGYLMKCGSKRRNWHKRWFVLTNEKLVYSTSHMDTKPHRQFAFSDILDAFEYEIPPRQPQLGGASPVVTNPVDGGEGQGSHTFKIVTTKRTLLLCAPGEDDEIKWLGAIRALIARRSGSPGQRVATASSMVAAGEANKANSGFSSGNPSVKAKGRRLSASGGSGLSGSIAEEGTETHTQQN